MFKAHRLLYHSTLGSRIIKKKKYTGRGSTHQRSRTILKLTVWRRGTNASTYMEVVGHALLWWALPQRRARIQGSKTFVSLNSRLESNKGEEKVTLSGRVAAPEVPSGLCPARSRVEGKSQQESS